MLSPVIPGFRAVAVRRNRTDVSSDTLESKLVKISDEIGPDLADALWRANSDDIELFEIVRRRYQPRWERAFRFFLGAINSGKLYVLRQNAARRGNQGRLSD